MSNSVIIIGAGLAGLSATITLAEQGQPVLLVSNMPSERAQSVLAEGGINAALNLKGEDDSPEGHWRETLEAGRGLEDPETVHGLTEAAPDIIRWLQKLGVPFQTDGFDLDQRSFGGQTKKRTCYVKSSIGKMLMTALIDKVRGFETRGLVERISSGYCTDLILEKGTCVGCVVSDSLTGEPNSLYGPVLLATGGLNGLFGSHTTGSVINTGDVAACAFARGVKFADLEFIQYHPTTAAGPGKRLLISEAARAEGGRLFVLRDGKPWYFMEEQYPELGNLMPRDVVSREMVSVVRRQDCDNPVYLDMTGLPEAIWRDKLPDLRNECRDYVGLDPMEDPVPVEPGIHYFMGGIHVDAKHRTSMPGLYAAGECAAIYHGANRLGGNSTLGAIYGGQRAAETILTDGKNRSFSAASKTQKKSTVPWEPWDLPDATERRMQEILFTGMGLERSAGSLRESLQKMGDLEPCSERQERRILFAQGMLESALFRTETRGAHVRTDYPESNPAFQKKTVVQYRDGQIEIHLEGEEQWESG